MAESATPVPLVTLTTDFGLADGYVGAMKGVILSIAPDARLVDISHEIAPQNIQQAVYVLSAAYPFFPPHTVHLVVVDPGVGGARRPIALRTPAGRFVGPDNGVFSDVLTREPGAEVIELADPRYRLPQVSDTFHGRDIFAPAAAYLARGVPLAELGPPVHDPVILPPPRLESAPGAVTGEIVHIDRFGNLITNITPRDAPLNGDVIITVGGEEMRGVRRTYAEAGRGALLALIGSDGHLEIAVREGNAARRLGLSPGAPVTVRWK